MTDETQSGKPLEELALTNVDGATEIMYANPVSEGIKILIITSDFALKGTYRGHMKLDKKNNGGKVVAEGLDSGRFLVEDAKYVRFRPEAEKNGKALTYPGVEAKTPQEVLEGIGFTPLGLIKIMDSKNYNWCVKSKDQTDYTPNPEANHMIFKV